MKRGDNVLILPSFALNEMGLGELAGTRARVVEVVFHFEELQGCWVELPNRFLGEVEWYIPASSLI